MTLFLIMDLELLLTGINHHLHKREDTVMKLQMEMQLMIKKLKMLRILPTILFQIMDSEQQLTGINLSLKTKDIVMK